MLHYCPRNIDSDFPHRIIDGWCGSSAGSQPRRLQLHEPAVEKLQKRLTTDQQGAESDSAIEIFQQTQAIAQACAFHSPFFVSISEMGILRQLRTGAGNPGTTRSLVPTAKRVFALLQPGPGQFCSFIDWWAEGRCVLKAPNDRFLDVVIGRVQACPESFKAGG